MADHALAPVVLATSEVRRIEKRIANIANHRAKLANSIEDPSIAGAMLDQAERLRIQQAAALSELANAHVRLETVRKAASKTVGQNQALTALVDKKRADVKLESRRRLLR